MATPTSLFPDIPTAEQIARYKEIMKIIDGYRRGNVPFSEVDALSQEEVMEAREWVNEVTVARLMVEDPEFSSGLDEDAQ
jgi:hypothetical protein